MNIGINTLFVNPNRGGAKTYLSNLVRHLAKVDSNNTYFLFVSSLNEGIFERLGKNFKKILIPLRSDNRLLRLFYEQFVIPLYIRRHKIDVLFSPGNIATLFPGCKQVLTIHGPLVIRKLRQRYAPGEISKLQALFYDFMLPLSVKRADMIIAVSQDIKRWLLQGVNIPATKVRIVYEGVDPKLLRSTVADETMGVKRPYILFLSTLFRYKNADKLIKAFAYAKQQWEIPHSLVIAGRDPAGQVDWLRRLAKDLGVLDSIYFLGRIPHEQVGNLYRYADLFVYPSTVESFGLPALEAMACGTPVIGSNRCSVPEIIGDAGLIVNPDNIEEMAEAIYRLLNDQKLRNRLIQKGFERVKMFTWERAARETLQVFEEVYQEEHSK